MYLLTNMDKHAKNNLRPQIIQTAAIIVLAVILMVLMP